MTDPFAGLGSESQPQDQPFDTTSLGVATNTALGLLNVNPFSADSPWWNTAKDLFHGIARSFGSTIQSAYYSPSKDQSAIPNLERPAEPGIQQNLFDFLYGKEGGDVKPLQTQIADMESSIKSSPLAQKYGFDKVASPLAFGAVIGSTGLDLTMGMGGEEELGKIFLKETDPAIIGKLLGKMGISEDLIPKFSEMFAKASTPEEVKQGFNLLKGAHGAGELAKTESQLSYQNAKSWTINELQTAVPGSRITDVNGDIVGSKSTFPDWVTNDSRDLAHRDLFDKAIPHLIDGTVPAREGRVKQLVELAREQIGKVSGFSKDEMFNMEGGFPGKSAAGVKTAAEPLAQEAAKTAEQGVRPTAEESLHQALGDPSKKGMKALAPDLLDSVQGWINKTRRATLSLEASSEAIKFKTLDAEGMDAFAKIQSGETSGDYGKVRQFFDDWYNKLKTAGVDMGKRINYFPQLWANSDAEIQAITKKLSLKPGFTQSAVFENYAAGKAAGLTPRFDTVSKVAGWYQQRASKLMADTEFFNYLKDNFFIRTDARNAAGWKAIDPNVFPTKGRVVYAPVQLADAIETYLKRATTKGERFWEGAANITSALKNLVMSVGIPKTGINIHGFTELARTLGSPEGRGKAFLQMAKWMVNPESAKRVFEDNIDHALYLSKIGGRNALNVSAEDHILKGAQFLDKEAAGGKILQFTEDVRNKLYDLFGKNTFQKVLPAAKTEGAWSYFQSLKAQGYSEKEAASVASDYYNTLFGGLNYEAMGRDKMMQNMFRSIAFAPDFLETNLRLGKGVAKAFYDPSNPQGKAYRNYAYTIAGLYMGANALNYKNTGKFMWENGYGHETDIALGQDSEGRTVYFKPFGSSVDFARLPLQVAHMIWSGDPNFGNDFDALINNRLSKPFATVEGLRQNVDPFGNPLHTKDRYGRPIPSLTGAENIASLVLGNVAPAEISNLPGYFGGTKSTTQTVMQGLGLPFAFKKESAATSQDPFAGLGESRVSSFKGNASDPFAGLGE